MLRVAPSASIPNCQSGECAIFEFWFVIFRRLNKSKLQVRAADPFLMLYLRSEYEPSECTLHQTAAAAAALFLSATRMFYLYALGVSSVMLKKVA